MNTFTESWKVGCSYQTEESNRRMFQTTSVNKDIEVKELTFPGNGMQVRVARAPQLHSTILGDVEMIGGTRSERSFRLF